MTHRTNQNLSESEIDIIIDNAVKLWQNADNQQEGLKQMFDALPDFLFTNNKKGGKMQLNKIFKGQFLIDVSKINESNIDDVCKKYGDSQEFIKIIGNIVEFDNRLKKEAESLSEEQKLLLIEKAENWLGHQDVDCEPTILDKFEILQNAIEEKNFKVLLNHFEI